MSSKKNSKKKTPANSVKKKPSPPTSKKNTKHSPDLNLRGLPDPVLQNLKILKNLDTPDTRWGGGKWDHLIYRLEEGDCIELEVKSANSFANRARNLGYVIVMRKHTETITRVWFEGMDPHFAPKKETMGQ